MAHINITGQSQTGKSTLALEMTLESICAGHAVVYLDPTGDDIDYLLKHIPKKRREDVLVFDPTKYQVPWNFLETHNIPLTVDELTFTLKTAWGVDSENTPVINLILSNALYAVIETGGGLFDLYLMLASFKYREKQIASLKNDVVKKYWLDFLDEKQADQIDQLRSVYNKVQPLMADPRIRAMAGRQSRMRIPELLNNKVLLLRLCQGELGSGKSKLLGSLALAQIHKSTLRRDTAIPLDIYINNVQTFMPTPIIQMIASVGTRNARVVTIEQYLGQLDLELRAAIKANCIQYVFRVSYEDSKAFPEVPPQAIQPYALPPWTAWLFGMADRPQMITLPTPNRKPLAASAKDIDAIMRENYVASALAETTALLAQFS